MSASRHRCWWGRCVWGGVAATTPRRHRERWVGTRRRRPRRAGVRGEVDGRAHGAVRRGDPEGPRRRADLPDRPRRGRRHDGRLRLRRTVWDWGSRWSRTSSTSWRVRRASRRRAAGVLRPGRCRAGCTRHVLYTGLVGMGVGYVRVAAGRHPLAGAGRPSWRGSSPPPCSATSCGTRRCSTCSRRGRGPAPTCCWSPLAAAVKGVPLLLFVGVAVSLARGTRAAVAARRRWPARSGSGGITARELADLEDPRRRRRARRAMRARAGEPRGAAARPAAAGAGGAREPARRGRRATTTPPWSSSARSAARCATR